MVEGAMNPTRLRPRVAATGRIAIRLNTVQRDLFTRSPKISRELVFALRNAPVRDGKLSVRVRLGELESLITAAASAPAPGRREERELATLVRYLEGLEDRFEISSEETEDARDAEPGEHDESRRAGMSEE